MPVSASARGDDCAGEIASEKFTEMFKQGYRKRSLQRTRKLDPKDRAHSMDKLVMDLIEFEVKEVPQAAQPAFRRGLKLQETDHAKALAAFDEALKTAPRATAILGAKYEIYADERKMDKALPVCDQALKIDSRSETFYLRRAYCFFSLKRYAEGVDDCTKAITINPRNMMAYAERSKGYRKLGNFTAANIDMDKIHQLNLPRQVHEYLEHGQDQAALVAVNQAMQAQPNRAVLGTLKAECYRAQHHYKEAIDEYNRVMQACPKAKFFVSASRAQTYAAWADYDRAIADWDYVIKTLEASPPMPILSKDESNPGILKEFLGDFRCERADSLLKAKRYAQALADCNTLVAKRGESDDYALRAAVYEAMGESDKAMSDYNLACKRSPSVKALHGRAAMYTKLGKKDLAAKDEEEAKKLEKVIVIMHERHGEQAFRAVDMLHREREKLNLNTPD